MRDKRGQGMLEFAFLIIAAILALSIMAYYVRNSLCGKFRESADSVGQGAVYDPDTSTQ